MNLLLRRIRAARRRLMIGRVLQHLVHWSFGALAVGALLAWISRTAGPWPFWPIAGLLAAAAVAGALVSALRRPVSLRTAALSLDRAAGSQERILTAMALGSDSSPAADAVRRDAMSLVESLDARSVPIGRPRRLRWLAAPLLAGIAAFWLPARAADPGAPPRTHDAHQPPLPAALRKDQAMKLHRRAFELEKKLLDRNAPAAKDLGEAMKQAADALRKTEMKPAEALAKISSLEEKLRQRRDELGKNAALAPNLADRRSPGGAGGRQADELAQRLAGLEAKLGAAMKELGRAGAAPDAARRKAALKELADALKGLEGESARRLEEMLKAMDEGRSPDPAEALKEFEKELAEMEEALAEWDALDDELAQLEEMKEELADAGRCRRCGQRGRG